MTSTLNVHAQIGFTILAGEVGNFLQKWGPNNQTFGGNNKESNFFKEFFRSRKIIQVITERSGLCI